MIYHLHVYFQGTRDKKPFWAFASGPHGGDGERVILPLHVNKIVNGLLAGENVFFWQSLFHYQVGQWHHLVVKFKKAGKFREILKEKIIQSW